MKDLASALDELPYRESRKKARKEDPKLILIAIHDQGFPVSKMTASLYCCLSQFEVHNLMAEF